MEGEALNPTQSEILKLSGEIIAFVKQRSSDDEVILAALAVAAKVVWRPSPHQQACQACAPSTADGL